MPHSRVTVLQVLPSLISGGVERSTVDVAEALTARGDRALVASAGGPMIRDLYKIGATHYNLPLANKMPWHIFRNSQKLKNLIIAEDVDIIHARSRAPAWSAHHAAKVTGRRFVTTFHGTYSYKSSLKKRYNAIMTKGDLVIANSNFIGQHVRNCYGLAETRLRIIPRGIDLDFFNPANVSHERIVCLSKQWHLVDGVPIVMLPGRLTRWKGHLIVLKALAHLLHTAGVEACCVIVGGEKGNEHYREELLQKIKALNLVGKILLVGHCQDMPAAYLLADVVISASSEPEAFGRVAAEASAMSRLVIASNHGGSCETIVHNKTGWLTAPGDHEALAESLITALTLSTAERLAIGARGRAHISQYFTKKKMTDNTLSVYEELCISNDNINRS